MKKFDTVTPESDFRCSSFFAIIVIIVVIISIVVVVLVFKF